MRQRGLPLPSYRSRSLHSLGQGSEPTVERDDKSHARRKGKRERRVGTKIEDFGRDGLGRV